MNVEKVRNKQKICGQKASFTVEASLIMTILLPVLVALIYLSFYVHDSAVLQGITCELAAKGSCLVQEKNTEELLRKEKEHLTASRFTGLQGTKVSVNVGEESISVSGSGEFYFPGLIARFFGGNTKTISKSWSREILKPADRIRKIRGLKYMVDRIKE